MEFVRKIVMAVAVVCIGVFTVFYGVSGYNTASFAKEELARAEKYGLLKKIAAGYELPEGRLKIDAVIADATDFTVFYSLKSWKGVNPDFIVVDDLGREYQNRAISLGNKKGLYRFDPIKPDAKTATIKIKSVQGSSYELPVTMDFLVPYQQVKLLKEGETKTLDSLVLTIDRLVLGTTKTLVEITAKGNEAETDNCFLQTDSGIENNRPFNPVLFINGKQLEGLESVVNSDGKSLNGVFSFAPVEEQVAEIKLSLSNIPIAQEIELEKDIFAKDIVLLNKRIPNGEGAFLLRRVFNPPTENKTQIYYDVEGETLGKHIIASQFYVGQTTMYEGKHHKISSSKVGDNLIVFSHLPKSAGKYKLLMAFPQEPIVFNYNF